MQEAAVRPAVDDVERALEHAEERERRPEQERAADDAERRSRSTGSPRTARRIESTDVLGNVFESSRTKNDPSSAWCTSPSSASARKSSGTNERSAKYAIIAARCVPRSAKNLLTTRLTARQYARRHGRSPGDRRSDRDLAAGPGGRVVGADGSRRRLERARRRPRERLAERRAAARRGGGARCGPDVAQLEAATAQRQRLRRARRRAR